MVVRSIGIFTPTETSLSTTEEGRKLIKSSRQELRSINRGEIELILADILGCKVCGSYYDVDVESAEQMEVYVLETDMEKRLLRQGIDRLPGQSPMKA